MNDLMKLFTRMTFAPEDGTGGGADPGGAAPGAGDGGSPAGDPPGGGTPSGSGQAADPGAPYRVEGVPESMFGDNDHATIDNMARALKGYRDRDAERDVPDDVAAYRDFGEVDATLKPYFETLEGDGMFDDLAEQAKEHGISKKAFTALVTSYMKGAHDLGILEPPVDKAAERAALLPESAKNLPKAEQDTAIERRMNDNFAWVESMKARGLSDESADHLTMMLGDSAKGHMALEFFRQQIAGSAEAQPGGAGGAGGGKAADAKADLQRRAGLPENSPGNAKFDQASYDQLQADYVKIHGE